MRAVRFFGPKQVRVDEVEQPTAAGPGEVLIRPRWCGICGSDLHEYVDGPIFVPREPHPLTGFKLPSIMGHEFSAEIVEAGAEVESVRAGDRVSIMPLIYCGACYFCIRGEGHRCEKLAVTGVSWPWGGMAEYAVVPEYQAARIPDGMTYEEAAVVEPAAVAVYAIDRGNVKTGDAVLVAGAGPIGLLVALAASAAGASEVFVSEPNPSRAARAEAAGASAVFDPGKHDVTQEVRRRTGGVGVDVAVECVGNGPALEGCVDAVRKGGVVVQTGVHTHPAEVRAKLWTTKDLTIVGSWAYPVFEWPRVITMVANGAFPVERVVTSKVGLEDVVAGFDALLEPGAAEVKVLVSPD